MSAQKNISIGVVSYIQGHVTVKSSGEIHDLKMGDMIYREDVVSIMTDQGNIKVLMVDGTTVNIEGKLPFDFHDYLLIENDEAQNPTDQHKDHQDQQGHQQIHHQPIAEEIQHIIQSGVKAEVVSDAINACISLDDPENENHGLNIVVISRIEKIINYTNISNLFLSDTVNNIESENFSSKFPIAPPEQTAPPEIIPIAPPSPSPVSNLMITNSVNIFVFDANSNSGHSSNGTIFNGSDIIYTITVTNAGPNPAQSITITDVLPAHLQFISADNGGVNHHGTIAWSLGSLAVGASDTVTFIAKVDDPATLPITNSGITINSHPASQDSVTFTPTPLVDLGVTNITDIIGSVTPGSSMTYTIIVTNHGPSNVAGASFIDFLPSSFNVSNILVSTSTGSSSGILSINGNNITDTLNLLDNGTATFTVTGTINASATGSISNQVSVSPPGNILDNVLGNNTAIDSDNLTPKAVLTVSKDDHITNVIAGNTDTYTIVVTNSGPSDAYNVVVQDMLSSQGFTNISSPDASFNSNTDSWNVGTIAAGGSVTLHISGTVPANATGSSYENDVKVNSSDAAQVTASDIDTLNQNAVLTLTKSDGLSSITAGNTDTYTIVVSNTGPSDAYNVVVQDMLAAQGFTNISSPNLPANVAFDPSTDSWNVGTIAAGSSVTLYISGTVPSNALGSSYENDVKVTSSDALKVTAHDTDILNQNAVLTLTKSDGLTSITAGNTDTYTIVVSNTGYSDAYNVVVQDILPSQGFTNISSPNLPAGVTFNANTDSWNIGTIAAGSSVTLYISGTVPANATGSTYENDVKATSSDALKVTANDTDTLNQQCDLSIVKTVSDVQTITDQSGHTFEVVTYSYLIENAGPSAATGIVVADNFLPANLVGNIITFSSPNEIGGSGFTFDSSSGNWSGGTLNAGASTTLTFQAILSNDPQNSTVVLGDIHNTATVSSTTLDSNLANNVSSADILHQVVWMPDDPAFMQGSNANGYALSIQDNLPANINTELNSNGWSIQVLQLPSEGTVEYFNGSQYVDVTNNQVLSDAQFNSLVYVPANDSQINDAGDATQFKYGLFDGVNEKALGIVDLNTVQPVAISTTIGSSTGSALTSGNEQISSFNLPSNVSSISDFSNSNVTLNTDFQFAPFPKDGSVPPAEQPTGNDSALAPLQEQVSLFLNIGGMPPSGNGGSVSGGIEFTILSAPDTAAWHIVNIPNPSDPSTTIAVWSLTIDFNNIVETNNPNNPPITLTEYLNGNPSALGQLWNFIYTDNTGGNEQARFATANFNFTGQGIFFNGSLHEPNIIYGSSNNDQITGGLGNDVITGDGGRDTFYFNSTNVNAVNQSTTTITDFNAQDATNANNTNADTLSLSDVLTGGSTSQATIDSYLHATTSNGNTTIDILSAPNGTVAHTIQLEGVVVPGATSNDIINHMLAQHNLVVHA